MQRRIERAVLHLQEVVGGPLNVLADLVTMSWPVKKRSQDEHVERALEKTRAPLLCLFRHRRQSTLNLGGDGRRSTIACQGMP
jgi:hypothetical protein